MPQMLIANRLQDGRVVFLAKDGAWVASIRGGYVADSESDGERLLALARRAEAACEVVDPYLIEVRARDGAPEPVVWREAIRAGGPTVQTGRA